MDIICFSIIFIIISLMLYKKIDTSLINLFSLMAALILSKLISFDFFTDTLIFMYNDTLKMLSFLTICIGLLNNFNYYSIEFKEDNLYRRGIIFLVITSAIAGILGVVLGSSSRIGIRLIPLENPNNYLFLIVLAFIFYVIINRGKDSFGIKVLIPYVQKIMPYALFIYCIRSIEINGYIIIGFLLVYISLFFISSIIQVCLTHGILCKLLSGKNIKDLLNECFSAYIFAFNSRSSAKTAPILTNELYKNSNEPKGLISHYTNQFVKVAMNGCTGLFPGFIAIISLNIFGMPLTPNKLFLIIVGVIIVSVAMREMPGIASLSSIFLLTILGLNIDVIFLIIGVDYIIDKIRTTLNIIAVSNTVNIL